MEEQLGKKYATDCSSQPPTPEKKNGIIIFRKQSEKVSSTTIWADNCWVHSASEGTELWNLVITKNSSKILLICKVRNLFGGKKLTALDLAGQGDGCETKEDFYSNDD